jgi:hypothetical protein
MIHRHRHPTIVDDCLPCKLLSVNLSAHATPSRYKGGLHQNPDQFDRDLDAYRTARKLGLQPDNGSERSSRRARRAAGDYEKATA